MPALSGEKRPIFQDWYAQGSESQINKKALAQKTMKYLIFNLLSTIKSPFSRKARKRRMEEFIRRMGVKGGERIIDLGGAPGFWEDCPLALRITIVNLPGFNSPVPPVSHHTITLIEGDACAVDFAGDMSYDMAFSNSVIEHVGDGKQQKAFAAEVHRLAPSHWVQTPSIWFPMEAHTNMPLWWFYPSWLKKWFLRRWRSKLPGWTDMVEGTTVLLYRDLERYFPGSRIWVERKFGFPKSYVSYKTSN